MLALRLLNLALLIIAPLGLDPQIINFRISFSLHGPHQLIGLQSEPIKMRLCGLPYGSAMISPAVESYIISGLEQLPRSTAIS
jgi:hypothetical protein